MPSVNQGDQTIQFRKQDAQRIAATVYAHEAARRGRNPSTLGRSAGGAGGGGIDEVRFVGAWPVDTEKQVFYASDTTNTSTASALNFLCSILPDPGYRRALVATSGTTLVLINSQC
jgi:hypothetical protein